jgi:hypothetical protein
MTTSSEIRIKNYICPDPNKDTRLFKYASLNNSAPDDVVRDNVRNNGYYLHFHKTKKFAMKALDLRWFIVIFTTAHHWTLSEAK